MRMKSITYIITLSMTLFLAGCRHDELVVPTEYDIINDVPDPETSFRGF